MKNTKNKISSNVSKELGISKKESKRFVNVFVKIIEKQFHKKQPRLIILELSTKNKQRKKLEEIRKL